MPPMPMRVPHVVARGAVRGVLLLLAGSGCGSDTAPSRPVAPSVDGALEEVGPAGPLGARGARGRGWSVRQGWARWDERRALARWEGWLPRRARRARSRRGALLVQACRVVPRVRHARPRRARVVVMPARRHAGPSRAHGWAGRAIPGWRCPAWCGFIRRGVEPRFFLRLPWRPARTPCFRRRDPPAARRPPALGVVSATRCGWQLSAQHPPRVADAARRRPFLSASALFSSYSDYIVRAQPLPQDSSAGANAGCGRAAAGRAAVGAILPCRTPAMFSACANVPHRSGRPGKNPHRALCALCLRKCAASCCNVMQGVLQYGTFCLVECARRPAKRMRSAFRCGTFLPIPASFSCGFWLC